MLLSLGGNLALALTRYLVTNKGSEVNLPSPPGRLLLLSPWVDLRSTTKRDPTYHDDDDSGDYLGPNSGATLEYAKYAFVGPRPLFEAAINPYISPASRHPDFEISFKGFPSTMIVAGGSEMFMDQINTLRKRMMKDLGDGVSYYEAVDTIHDFLIFPWWEPERTQTLEAISRWAKRTYSASR